MAEPFCVPPSNKWEFFCSTSLTVSGWQFLNISRSNRWTAMSCFHFQFISDILWASFDMLVCHYISSLFRYLLRSFVYYLIWLFQLQRTNLYTFSMMRIWRENNKYRMRFGYHQKFILVRWKNFRIMLLKGNLAFRSCIFQIMKTEIFMIFLKAHLDGLVL